jgi:hypothetical protein
MGGSRGKRFFDPVRRKNVAALPEERVRRQLVDWLVSAIGVPPRLISVEYSLSKLDPRCRKRADVVVWRPSARSGGLEPWLLAECKAPGIQLNESVADQARGYAAKVRAEHVLITNGERTFCHILRGSAYQPIQALPRYTEA